MIEVTLELRLDSFLVNSVGGSGDLAGSMPAKALRFVCQKIASVRQLTDNTPTADFDFLGTSAQQDTRVETDRVFDDQLSNYLSTHSTVDISRINVSSGATGYSTTPKGEKSGEIGRMVLARLADQSSVGIELVLASDEFEAVWELITKQQVQQVSAVLVCFKLPSSPPPESAPLFVAGILTSSLRMMPRAGG